MRFADLQALNPYNMDDAFIRGLNDAFKSWGLYMEKQEQSRPHLSRV
jgi:hypothetical protein